MRLAVVHDDRFAHLARQCQLLFKNRQLYGFFAEMIMVIQTDFTDGRAFDIGSQIQHSSIDFHWDSLARVMGVNPAGKINKAEKAAELRAFPARLFVGSAVNHSADTLPW